MFLWLVGAVCMVIGGHEGVFNGLSLIGLGFIAWATIRRFREERNNA